MHGFVSYEAEGARNIDAADALRHVAGAMAFTTERLKAQGIVPHACLDHGMTTSFYYADPDGNSVEMQCDNFGDWAKSTQYMQTAPEFAADPIGVHLEPDRMLAAREQGASAEEIHQRAMAGEFTADTPLDLRLPAA